MRRLVGMASCAPNAEWELCITTVEREFASLEEYQEICLTDTCFFFTLFSEKTCGAYGSKRGAMSWPCGDQDIELLRRQEL